MPQQRASKRRRGAVACLRCKTRKHRCDNGYPTCGSCFAADVDCIYSGGNHPTGYVQSLEGRLQETRNQDAQRRSQALDENDQQSRITPIGAGPETADQPVDAPTARILDSDAAAGPRQEGDVPELDASDPIAFPYLGVSSGFPLASMMQSAIHLSDQGGGTFAANSWLPAQNYPGNSHRSSVAGPNNSSAAADNAIMPGKDMSERLIAAYLNKVHTKHPFLSPRRIHDLADQRYNLSPASQFNPNKSLRRSFDYCLLHLIYAIGSRYLQLSEEYDYRPPADHYTSARADIRLASVGRSLDSLEVMTLLSIYQLRSPGEIGIWSIVGATMRQALGCGLHRSSSLPTLLDQRRKRIFWTVYMLERSISLTFGRPFCVSERDIDVEFPANVADDINDEQDMIKAIEDARLKTDTVHAISPAIHIFRLHRIISRIQYTVHRVDRPISSIDAPKTSQLRQDLEDWKLEIRNHVPLTDELDALSLYVTERYHILQYYKCLLFLLLPTLTQLSSTHPDFRVCAAAAGQVGQIYRHLHNTQKIRISYSFLAVHAILVAGLTLVYCFITDRTIFDAKFSSDIRACGSILCIIAERWPAARKARDCFERFVQATVENEEQPRLTHIDTSALPLNLQQVYHNAGAALFGPAAGNSVMQTDCFEVADLSGSNDMWDILGHAFDDQEHGWSENTGAQYFSESG